MDPHEESEREPGSQQDAAPVISVSPMSAAARTALKIAAIVLFACVIALAAWMGLGEAAEEIEEHGGAIGWSVVLGRTAGLLAAALLMIQFVLSARLAPLDEAFGLDRLLRFHRYTGASAVTLALLHPILLFVTPLYTPPSPGLASWRMELGSLALTLLLLIGVTSIWRKFLNLSYEWWHRIHYLAFVVVALVGVHSLELGHDLQQGWTRQVWLGMLGGYALLFVWAKIARPLLVSSRKWRVESVAAVSHDTWRLDLAPQGHPGIRQVPGQFGLLTVRREDAPTECHPFTISSPPREDGSVSFTIKESGDYTSKIGDTREGATGVVEGPYGQFCHLRHGGERFVMIAGGVGITPILSMLRYMAAQEDERPVTLIWGNRTEDDILYREELERLQDRLDLRVVHVLSRQEDFEGETGYVDAELLERALSEDELQGHVYLCGPPAMMDMVHEALEQLGVADAHIHSERFEL